MSAINSVQAVEDAAGVHLFGFDAEEACVLALGPLREAVPASLQGLMRALLAGEMPATPEAQPDACYARVTDDSAEWAIIAEWDADGYRCYEQETGRAGRRLAGVGYVLGYFHQKPEGNWFEHAGEGSIWQYTWNSPISAESVLEETGLDCEIHSVARLIEQGCRLDGM